MISPKLAYYRKHGEEILVKRRIDRQTPKAKRKGQQYRQANKAHILAVQKVYRLANIRKYREYARKSEKKIRRTPEGAYKMYKANAGKRGFSLTFDQFMTFWQKPCWYSGHKIETIGLDRIDNSKGYEMDNVVPCCFLCNRAKNRMSYAEFIEWARTFICNPTLAHI